LPPLHERVHGQRTASSLEKHHGIDVHGCNAATRAQHDRANFDRHARKSLHVEQVPLPELAPDEAYVAVMASSINFNTVWTK